MRQSAMRRDASSRSRPHAPAIHQLERDDDQRAAMTTARQPRDEGAGEERDGQDGQRGDGGRERPAPARPVIRHAAAQVDPGQEAPEAGGPRVREPEAEQLVAAARLPPGDAVQRLRAEERVERRDHGEAACRADQAGQHGPELRLVRQREEAGEIGGRGHRLRHGPDHSPEALAVAEKGERIVRAGAGDQPGDHRRHSRCQPPDPPDHHRRAEADGEGEGLHGREVAADLRRRDVGRRPRQRADLRDQDQERHRVLESRHHRRGDVLDQGADAEGADQRLEHPGQQDDEEEKRQRLLHGPRAAGGGRRGRDRLQDDRAQQQSEDAPRGVDRRAAGSERERRQRHEGRAIEAGEDGVGDVLIAERVEGEDAIADAGRDAQEGGGGAAHHLTANACHSRSRANDPSRIAQAVALRREARQRLEPPASSPAPRIP
jgi:hypothetical protein